MVIAKDVFRQGISMRSPGSAECRTFSGFGRDAERAVCATNMNRAIEGGRKAAEIYVKTSRRGPAEAGKICRGRREGARNWPRRVRRFKLGEPFPPPPREGKQATSSRARRSPPRAPTLRRSGGTPAEAASIAQARRASRSVPPQTVVARRHWSTLEVSGGRMAGPPPYSRQDAADVDRRAANR